ncbi:MAG: lysylphosphatidylglycerol synthase transmembrane domain-containing protein [Lachnospiraceae bacterium]|nr:lysylphosphatidylglycerol synthase transmembrane domain-containing protein [Lachnospiraceae bacterium]
MQSYKKNLLNISLLLALVGLTFYILLQDQDMDEVLMNIRKVQPFFLLLALVLALARIYGEAVSIYLLGNSLQKEKIKFWQCVKYSLGGFFFCAITPSASGGQPAQIYYMKKDGMSVANSSLVLVLITIIYRGTLLVFGVGILLFCYNTIYKNLGLIRFWFLFGMAVNTIIVVVFCFLLFSKKIIRWMMEKVIRLLAKLHLVKRQESFADRCDSVLTRYHKSAAYMKQHKSVMYLVVVINMLQRLLMFAATYAIYLGFGLEGESLIHMVLLQSVVAICADMLPLPGGVGANEQCFISVYRRIFEAGTIPAMLLVRGVNFYLLAIVSAMLVCGIQILTLHKENKKV